MEGFDPATDFGELRM
jgi:5'-3' exoribonuclease 1